MLWDVVGHSSIPYKAPVKELIGLIFNNLERFVKKMFWHPLKQLVFPSFPKPFNELVARHADGVLTNFSENWFFHQNLNDSKAANSIQNLVKP